MVKGVRMAFTRITVDPQQMDGVPCIRHLRIPVATVVSMLSDGMSQQQILRAYPDLEPEDIREVLQYATEAVKERGFALLDARSLQFPAGGLSRAAVVIAILDDDAPRRQAMAEVLRRGAPSLPTAFFDNAPDMIAWLRENLGNVCLLCMDHDLGPNRVRDNETFDPGTGRDVADFLATHAPVCPVLIHSTNAEAAQGMQIALQEAGWSVQRVSPFGDLAWIQAEWFPRVAALLPSDG